MKGYWKVLLALALVVVIPVGGLWLWGRPRSHVAMPTGTTSPADVVRTYAHAMNERDYGACTRMGVVGAGDPNANWFTLHGPQIRDLKIVGVGRVMSGSQASDPWSDPSLRHWQQTVNVDTSETLINFDGTPDPEPGHAFSFTLVRHDSSQPWRIFGSGEG